MTDDKQATTSDGTEENCAKCRALRMVSKAHGALAEVTKDFSRVDAAVDEWKVHRATHRKVA